MVWKNVHTLEWKKKWLPEPLPNGMKYANILRLVKHEGPGSTDSTIYKKKKKVVVLRQCEIMGNLPCSYFLNFPESRW